MSTTPTPLSIGLNDPVSGDIQAICTMLSEAFRFGRTDVGQKFAEQLLVESSAAQQTIARGWQALLKLVHGQ